MIGILIFLAWWFIGFSSLVYWWTDGLPLTVGDAFVLALGGGIGGPWALILAIPTFMHHHGASKVLMKARHPYHPFL